MWSSYKIFFLGNALFWKIDNLLFWMSLLSNNRAFLIFSVLNFLNRSYFLVSNFNSFFSVYVWRRFLLVRSVQQKRRRTRTGSWAAAHDPPKQSQQLVLGGDLRRKQLPRRAAQGELGQLRHLLGALEQPLDLAEAPRLWQRVSSIQSRKAKVADLLKAT